MSVGMWGSARNRIGSLIREHPERKADVQQMQKDMSFYMLATFADRFRDGAVDAQREHVREAAPEGAGGPAPEYQGVNLAEASSEDLENVLTKTVLGEFKTRLGRIGLEYQAPTQP